MGILSLVLACALVAGDAVTPTVPEPTGSEPTWSPVRWTDLDGRTWTTEDLEGRVVLLDFWATWCAPCLAELPNLRTIDRRFGARGLVLIGVALDTMDRRRLRAFLSRHDMRWPQVHVPRGVESDIAERFSVGAVPATLVFDREGRLVARDLRGRALELTIETLLGQEDGAGESSGATERASWVSMPRARPSR